MEVLVLVLTKKSYLHHWYLYWNHSLAKYAIVFNLTHWRFLPNLVGSMRYPSFLFLPPLRFPPSPPLSSPPFPYPILIPFNWGPGY